MGDQSLDKSSKGHPKAVLFLPKFLSNQKCNCKEKAVQTIENKSPDKSLDNFYEQPPNGSPDKASNKSPEESSDKSSDKSYHGRDSSSSYLSDDTEPMDICELEEYIKGSDKEQ